MGFARCFVLLALVGASVAFSGQYIPKSFYVIDKYGHKSDVVYIRNRRGLHVPHLRMRRGTGSQGGGQAGSFSYSSSGAGAGASGSNNFIFPDINPGAFVPDFQNFANNLQSTIGGLASRFGGDGAAGGNSFATSGASGNGFGHGTGFSSNQGHGGGHPGGLGAGYTAGGQNAGHGGGHSGGLGAGYTAGGQNAGHGGGQPGGLGAGNAAGGQNPGHGAGYDGPILFSRFGEDTGTGVHVSGAAQGPHAAFSSSSSSIDSNGKIKYSVQSGKY